jgi:hypothetical protein
MGAISGAHAEAATPSGSTVSEKPESTGSSPSAGAQGGSWTATASQDGTGKRTVDVAAILDKKGEKLAWKTSIVDLMKALDVDSSLAARKELAKEFGYTDNIFDSAAMNVWLHKKMMEELAVMAESCHQRSKHSEKTRMGWPSVPAHTRYTILPLGRRGWMRVRKANCCTRW